MKVETARYSRRDFLRAGLFTSLFALTPWVVRRLAPATPSLEQNPVWDQARIVQGWNQVRQLNGEFNGAPVHPIPLYRATVCDAMISGGASMERVLRVSEQTQFLTTGDESFRCTTAAVGCQWDDRVQIILSPRRRNLLGFLAHEATHAAVEFASGPIAEDYGFMGKLTSNNPRGFLGISSFEGTEKNHNNPFFYTLHGEKRNILAELAADAGRITYLNTLIRAGLNPVYAITGNAVSKSYVINHAFLMAQQSRATEVGCYCGTNFNASLLKHNLRSDRHGFFLKFGKTVLNWNPFTLRYKMGEADMQYFVRPENTAGVGLLAFLHLWRISCQPDAREQTDMLFHGEFTQRSIGGIVNNYFTRYHPQTS